jgi:hypothetical protein
LVLEEPGVLHLRHGLMDLTLFWVLSPLQVEAKEVCNKTTLVQLVDLAEAAEAVMVVVFNQILLVLGHPIKAMRVVVVDTLVAWHSVVEVVVEQEPLEWTGTQPLVVMVERDYLHLSRARL